MRILDRRVAVVTGAASGLGRAFAARFAQEGMKLVLADIDEVRLATLVEELRTAGHEVIGVPTDVAHLDAIENLAAKTLAAYGAVHLVVNNAGVAKHTGDAVWELSSNDWQWLMGVNFWGAVHALRVFVPIMLRQADEGHIVNTSSMAGLVTGGGGYGVAKHAVVSLSENLLVELQARGANIGVTCLCPGLVATNIADSWQQRPAELRDETEETEKQRAYRERIATFTRTAGMQPSLVASTLVDAIRNEQFYVCTEDPPSVVSGDERIRARLDAILARRNPVAIPLRRPEVAKDGD